MVVGGLTAIAGCSDSWYVDTGMYDTPEYGSVYLLGGERPAVVDTGIGADRERVFDALETAGIGQEELAAIVLTHVHLDHAGGAGYLADRCPNATVYVHERGARHLVDPERLVEGTKAAVGDQWQYYDEPRPIPESRIQSLSDGDRIDLGERTLQAHGAPGHASHQLVYEWREAATVFTGDAAGIYSPTADRVVPTTPPPEFDLEQCLADCATIAALDPERLCYGHFGAAAAEDKLRAYTNVLGEWVERVREQLEAGDDEETMVDRLAAANDMDAVWGERKARAEIGLNVRGVLNYLDA
jgi:glyoxylase-like metal-dependent hydrolase (beta-lactamase superfamily II)